MKETTVVEKEEKETEDKTQTDREVDYIVLGIFVLNASICWIIQSTVCIYLCRVYLSWLFKSYDVWYVSTLLWSCVSFVFIRLNIYTSRYSFRISKIYSFSLSS